jgi:thiol-disulfide isomerase/thioredoxin
VSVGEILSSRQEQVMKEARRNKPVPLVAVDEGNFGRRVLHAPVPVLALFGAPTCPASRALRPLLGELAASYADRIRFASINAERAGLLASQFGLHMTPTLFVAQGGEIVTQAVGFLPPELLGLLCEQIAAGALPPDPLWSPVESTFEDLVIAPLLERWGLAYLRQAASPAPARGRIDFLVYDDPAESPLTLFENKRQVASAQALAQAAAQAHGYARALGLPSCVVAAPAGLWIYASAGAQPALVRRVSSLELLQRPNDALAIMRQLRYAASGRGR